jgi:pyocin large subunit-like protein
VPNNIRGFISKYDRDLHFDLHGAEFTPPFGSAEEYEAAAIDFLKKPLAGTIAEGMRVKDGHIVRYDSATNEFAIRDTGGNVTTYFKPNPAIHGQSDNHAYFRRRVSE